MKAFAKRAYFNSTQIGHDMYAFAEGAQVLATEKVMEVQHRSRQFVNQQAGDLNRAMDPYTRPVGDFYRNYMAQHVKAAGDAMQPVYDRNVAPMVTETENYRRQKTNELWKAFADAFDEIVSLANKRCELHKKEIDTAPTMIRNRMQNVCKDPAVVIQDGLRMILVLLIIIFRRSIWSVIWGAIKMTTRSIWYVVSFRFLRSSKPKTEGVGETVEMDVEPQAALSAQ